MRIAVLCSGGDSPGMNAAVRTITAAGVGRGHEVLGIRNGYQGLLDNKVMEMELSHVYGISRLGGTILGTARSKLFPTAEGQKKARELWYLCRQYSAQEALQMGLINKVVPDDKLEDEVSAWCQEIVAKSPTAIRALKASFNADTESIVGINNMGQKILRLFYKTDEAVEGVKAFTEKRQPNFSSH